MLYQARPHPPAVSHPHSSNQHPAVSEEQDPRQLITSAARYQQDVPNHSEDVSHQQINESTRLAVSQLYGAGRQWPPPPAIPPAVSQVRLADQHPAGKLLACIICMVTWFGRNQCMNMALYFVPQ